MLAEKGIMRDMQTGTHEPYPIRAAGRPALYADRPALPGDAGNHHRASYAAIGRNDVITS